MPAKGQRQNLLDRLMRQVMPIPHCGCWLWLGGCDMRGHPYKPYGRIWVDGRTVPAHRVMWECMRGEIPRGSFVCHKCDTPECVNPDHLFIGAPSDNTQDMISKGRDRPTREARRGKRSNFVKLTAGDVLNIRADMRIQRIIAREYGITQTAVSHIKRRKNWGWL